MRYCTLTLLNKRTVSRCLFLAVLYACCSGLALADANAQTKNKRDSYSYLGIEAEWLEYQERLANFSIETQYSALNLGLQTGGYISVSEKFGFYLSSNKSVLWQTEEEEWSRGGVVLQRNDVFVSAANTRLTLAYQVRKNHSLLAGFDVANLEYNRFDFEVTAAGEALGILNPNGSQGRTDSDLADAISEEQLSVSFGVGYEYSDLFADKSRKGFAHQAQFMLGVPLHHRVTNTAVNSNKYFSDAFNGFDLFGRLSVGHYLSKSVLLAATLELIYLKREQIREGNVTVPQSETMQVKPGVTAYWSF